jgi:anti-sigma-K factor RskA
MTMPNHEPFLELAALAALEPLPAGDQAALGAHLAGCAECRAALDGFAAAAGALAWTLQPVAVPAGLKAKVFERLLAETQPPAAPAPVAPPRLTLVHDLAAERAKRAPLEPKQPEHWKAAAIALGLGLLASTALNFHFWGNLGVQSGQLVLLSGDKVALEQKVTGMHQEAEQRIAQLAVLQASDARMAKIPGQAMARDASAMMFWSAQEQAFLVAVSGMPAAEAGKTYQLWGVTPSGQKVSMCTFVVDARGSVVMRVELPKGGVTPAAAAVSLEPVGGMPQPTGPIVMMGELKI